MPVIHKAKKKCPKEEALTKEQALEFAQLILDIFKDKKQA
jgi:hypothetical protein